MKKRLLVIFTLGAVGGVLALIVNPVNSTSLKLAFLGCCFLAWLGFLLNGWRWKWVKIASLAVPFLLAIPFLLPARRIDVDELREDFVGRMLAYEGTRYYWGGENWKGIDCSGLPRRAFREALFIYGARHLDGGALRAAAGNWWFDAGARALAAGYRGGTVPLNRGGEISEMSYDGLLPGDLAITEGGAHMLAYAGDGHWIQADPGLGIVALQHGKEDPNGWFDVPVNIFRWRLLSKEGE